MAPAVHRAKPWHQPGLVEPPEAVFVNRRRLLKAMGHGAAIGAVAGILVTPITLTSYDVGTMLALKGFAAAMLGGMGNPIGAVVGGLLVGLAEYVAANVTDGKR